MIVYPQVKVSYVPQVSFDDITGILHITGEAYHEYAIEFFQPLFEELKRYMTDNPEGHLLAIFQLTYFNTSTARRFFELFSLMEDFYQNGGKVLIEWHYESQDTDIEESGLDFAAQVSFPFEMCALPA